jgi:hypothetical protein
MVAYRHEEAGQPLPMSMHCFTSLYISFFEPDNKALGSALPIREIELQQQILAVRTNHRRFVAVNRLSRFIDTDYNKIYQNPSVVIAF